MEDEEKAAESLELDKLKVSAKKTQAEETPPSSETQDEQAVSETKKVALETKKVAFWNILIPLVKDKIFVLSPETKIYAGHMGPTTVGWEKRTNPFLVGI